MVGEEALSVVIVANKDIFPEYDRIYPSKRIIKKYNITPYKLCTYKKDGINSIKSNS